MSAPPVIDTLARDAARRLFGAGPETEAPARIAAVEALAGGTGASTGALRLYRLEGGDGFVEKHTSSALEYALARAQLADTAAGLSRCPVMLRFLAAAPDPAGGYRLFMERLEGIGDNNGWLWGAEVALAEAAETFSQAIAGMRQRHGLALRPAPDVFGRLARALAGSESGKEDQIGGRLAALQAALAGYPSRPAHNDLFWPNIGRAPGSGGLVFLDFALVGDNQPGADFHHFAKGLKKSAQHRAFFLALTARAADLAGIPAGIIRAGACMSAAARALTRETRRGRPEAGQHQARRFIDLAEAALQGDGPGEKKNGERGA